MKKWMSVWLCLTGLGLALAPVDVSGQLLVRKKIFDSPETWVINKSYANARWNKDLYCQATSSSLAYIASFYDIPHGIDIEVDACWNRLLYTDHNSGQTLARRTHGVFGEGVNNYDEPMAVKVVSLTSDANWYLPYYDIFVADRGNHRVQQLRYRWTTPDSGMIHVRYLTADIWRPTDLDYSVDTTFDNPSDDVLWVACKSDKIVAFRPWNGQKLLSYGSTGSDVGQFTDIRAIVCGKTRQNTQTGTWFANNNYVYVLDTGNNRIVRLSRPSYNTVQWDMALDTYPCGALTDLEVDVLGHVWATSNSGKIYKFTKDLDVLGTFGSPGTGPNQFDNPVSIANPGGHMGCGDMMICESWTALSGVQLYAIGTDVNDLFVNTANISGTCYSYITLLLADYSTVTINIKNAAGTTLIKQLKNNSPCPSGIWVETWDGRNSSNVLVPWGNYLVEVIATSQYISRTTGLPVNSVTKSALFTLCAAPCQWRVGDANGDGSVDISDVVYLISYIFSGGAAPTPNRVGSGDADCSRNVDISDVVYLISRIFSGGPPPGLTCSCADYAKK
jgi:hypothetical protein